MTLLGIILAALSLLDISLLFYCMSHRYLDNSMYYSWSTFEIITGFLALVSALILIYGAYTRNSKVMQIYMGSAFLVIILMSVAMVLLVKQFCHLIEYDNDMSKKVEEACKDPSAQNHPSFSDYQGCLDFGMGLYKDNKEIVVFFGILINVGVIIFDIWTVFVAKNAKKEMEEADNMILLE